MAKKILITETVLRDAHQSLLATRMSTPEMEPVLEDLDKIGFHSLECWGGATYDSCLRFLHEDAWERLRISGISVRIQNSRCSSVARICWDTAITPTTL